MVILALLINNAFMRTNLTIITTFYWQQSIADVLTVSALPVVLGSASSATAISVLLINIYYDVARFDWSFKKTARGSVMVLLIPRELDQRQRSTNAGEFGVL